MNNGKIKVDLTRSLSSGKIEPSSLLQVKAKEKLLYILSKFVHYTDNKIDTNKSYLELEFSSDRVNNTIFVSGQRGAGKTTFLRTVLLERLEDTKDKILPLAFIDPTLISTNQHILVDIIAKFKQVVESNISSCGNEKVLNKFNQSLENMAEGLKLLKNSSSKNDDASWFLNKALKHAASGQGLEARFHQLIDVASEILDENLFIIAIDDVDNDTSKAYEVLELIRKYLTHSKIAVIISGDLRLYSHIVKQRKANELALDSFGKDQASDELIEHLEQQYLAKVLPIEQRVELKSLNDLIGGSDFSIDVKLNENNTKDLKTYLNEIFSESLSLDEKYLSSYIVFYLNQPVRTAFQILKSLPNELPANEQRFRNAFADVVRNSYIGALMKEKIDVDKLASQDVHQNTIGLALFELCSKYSELETGFYARPDGTSESYNASQLFLSQVIASYFSSENNHSVGAALKIMLTAGASANIYMNHVVDKMHGDSTSQDYINYIGLNRDQNLFSLSAHFSPFVFSKYSVKERQVNGGVARLPRSSSPGTAFPNAIRLYYGTEGSAKKITTLNNFVAEHNKNKTTFIEFLSAKTAIIASHSMIAKSEGRDYLSAYCLISSLSELLSCKDDEVSHRLIQLTSIQTFGAPSFADVEAAGEGSSENNEGDELATSDEVEGNSHHESMVYLITTWKENGKSQSFSPLLIGKIWARIMYSLASISENAKKNTVKVKEGSGKPKDILLGTLLSRFVFGIVNAILIEEVRFSKGGDEDLINKFSKSKNVASSSTEFYKNLKIVNAKYSENELLHNLPITASMLSCPLLWPYLGEWKGDVYGNEIFDMVIKLIDKQYNSNSMSKIFGDDYKLYLSGNFQRGLKFVSRLPISGCKYGNITKVDGDT